MMETNTILLLVSAIALIVADVTLLIQMLFFIRSMKYDTVENLEIKIKPYLHGVLIINVLLTVFLVLTIIMKG